LCCDVSHKRVVRVRFAKERRDGEHDFVKRESGGPVVLEDLRSDSLVGLGFLPLCRVC
jgi:hypothetical protein